MISTEMVITGNRSTCTCARHAAKWRGFPSRDPGSPVHTSSMLHTFTKPIESPVNSIELEAFVARAGTVCNQARMLTDLIALVCKRCMEGAHQGALEHIPEVDHA